MLNIENNIRHYVFPFILISLTAGLNIFLKKHFIDGGREDAYTHLHMQMNTTTGSKPEVQTIIPKSIRKKKRAGWGGVVGWGLLKKNKKAYSN